MVPATKSGMQIGLFMWCYVRIWLDKVRTIEDEMHHVYSYYFLKSNLYCYYMHGGFVQHSIFNVSDDLYHIVAGIFNIC